MCSSADAAPRKFVRIGYFRFRDGFWLQIAGKPSYARNTQGRLEIRRRLFFCEPEAGLHIGALGRIVTHEEADLRPLETFRPRHVQLLLHDRADQATPPILR